jgi:glycosyltransferase involved in cell wall biosynthesis
MPSQYELHFFIMNKNHSDHPLKILQVSTIDNRGGAARIAWTLHQRFQEKGFDAWMAVGHKLSDDPNVFPISNDDFRNQWARLWLSVGNLLSPFRGKILGAGILKSWLQWVGQPSRLLNILSGHEDFDFPGTHKILDLVSDKPDIAHLHNLHTDYFDLRFLAILSKLLPVVITLHDMWIFTGHCAHSFTCTKWKTGCRNCPDLTIYPAIKRGATFFNWHLKKNIYAGSRLYVATPSEWLMNKVKESIFTPAIIKSKVIPNGIDLQIFHPFKKQSARDILHIPQSAKVLFFAANGIKKNIWKDYLTLRSAVALVAERLHNQELLLIALGEDGLAEQIDKAEVRFVPYKNDLQSVARYYHAADIYLHAARADTFPNTILEALACGTPVIATAIGGIPEQIVDGKTGFLTQPGNAADMAEKIIQLLENDDLLYKMGIAAGKYACVNFSADRMVTDYLNFYQEALYDWQSRQSTHFHHSDLPY